MLPCRQWQTNRYEGRGRQEEAVGINFAGKDKQGRTNRQVKSARRGMQGKASRYAEV
jgi:hypothetical protein